MPDIKNCRQCGKALFPNYELGLGAASNMQVEPLVQRLLVLERGPITGYGFQNNNYFCNRLCGFNYAVDKCRQEEV